MIIDILLIIAGLSNIVDGVWSLIHPRLGHWWLSDLGRIWRTLIGVFLFFLGLVCLIVDLIER